ncbi:hypothetical protein [Arthrobacter koreensis]|uniref:hypothetical protein n=1 Tax=Arthrobacter koreensis TaxID=199136 RepID=UPI00381FAA01
MAYVEKPEKEVARLAAHPEGSLDQRLSLLPVNIAGEVMHQLIELPHLGGEPEHTVIVVPIGARGNGQNAPWERYTRSWECAVIASNDPTFLPASYVHGGEKVWIREDVLVRGTKRILL